jgi:two-component system CheB/CheR fusion protein
MPTSGSAAAEPQSKSNFLIAGIGGSAGSIPAFQTFFRNVPPDSGLAYVVILHLSPEYESRLAEVLQNSTSIPVTQVQDAVPVVPNHVYVIPPNRSLAMQDGMLVSSPVTSFEERRAPIDIFFRAKHRSAPGDHVTTRESTSVVMMA